jgi:hypothetical protein
MPLCFDGWLAFHRERFLCVKNESESLENRFLQRARDLFENVKPRSKAYCNIELLIQIRCKNSIVTSYAQKSHGFHCLSSCGAVAVTL